MLEEVKLSPTSTSIGTTNRMKQTSGKAMFNKCSIMPKASNNHWKTQFLITKNSVSKKSLAVQITNIFKGIACCAITCDGYHMMTLLRGYLNVT